MTANSKRRRIAILSFLLTPFPVSLSVSFSSWRTGTANLVNRSETRSPASRRANGISCRSYELFEEYDDWDDSDWDDSDDESVLLGNEPVHPSLVLNLYRGGHINKGRKSNSLFANVIRGSSNKKEKRSNTLVQLQALSNLQRQKLILFHKNFRRKQRQFQNSLYELNSSINPYFPKPPYNLWRIEPTQRIGKTSLTGKIFMLNIAAFALQTAYPALTAMGAKQSHMILNGQQLYRLFTPIFLHGGIGHLMTNSYSLKSMGMNVERSFGPARFLSVYFVSGIIGNIFSAVRSPNPAVGASGAIFGLVGAYYTFLSRNEELFGHSAQMQQNALIETIGMNLLLGMTNPMIDNWGHIGGFVGGVGMSFLFGPKLYVARVPAGEDSLNAGGFGVGKVVIDRPTVSFVLPQVLEDKIIVVRENLRGLGMRTSSAISNLFGPRHDTNIFLDNTSRDGVYKLVNGKEKAELPGSPNVTPIDGLRQDVSELASLANKQRIKEKRRSMPRPGRSLRPRYGHLYR